MTLAKSSLSNVTPVYSNSQQYLFLTPEEANAMQILNNKYNSASSDG